MTLVRQAFAAVRRLLADDGVFAFDIYQPNPDYLNSPDTDRLACSVTDDDGRRLEVREDTRYDPDSQVLTLSWRLRVADADGPPILARTRHRLWQYFPADLERIVATSGLVVRERYGDLDRSP
ncbi:MAG: hypothetical protein ACRDKX_01930 [Solirubrobacterales bacterium]